VAKNEPYTIENKKDETADFDISSKYDPYYVNEDVSHFMERPDLKIDVTGKLTKL
jgi:hypothetical protein